MTRILRDGTIRTILRAGIAAAMLSLVVLGLLAIATGQSFFDPINASVHAFAPVGAPVFSGVDLAHTLPGLIIHLIACIFWAILATWAFRMVTAQTTGAAWLIGFLTALVAAVVDFVLLPARLTPGWELVLPAWGVFLGLFGLGVGWSLGLQGDVNDI